MSKLFTAFEALRQAFDTFTAAEEASGLPAQHKPSVLLLTFNPSGQPNARCAITGDTEALVRVLLLGVDDNDPLREAMVNLIPDLLDRA